MSHTYTQLPAQPLFVFVHSCCNKYLTHTLSQTNLPFVKRNALAEVTACLRERLLRWQQIERLCGFPIIKNPGLANLTAQLYSDSIALGLPRLPQSSCLCHSSIHESIEDLLEDSSSPILPQMPGK